MKHGLRLGIDLFNRGEYWEAHEAWEADWIHDRKGPDSGFYKGLIQIAAGCLHYGRRNRRGAVNKWRSGASYLRPYLPAIHGVRLAPLLADAGPRVAGVVVDAGLAAAARGEALDDALDGLADTAPVLARLAHRGRLAAPTNAGARVQART